MPQIETEKLIKEYYNEVKEKYPYLDYERFEKICKSPFNFIVLMMSRKDMPVILIKYLGKLRVTSSNIYYLMGRNNKRFHFGRITQEIHQERDLDLKKKLKTILEDEAETPDFEYIEGGEED